MGIIEEEFRRVRPRGRDIGCRCITGKRAWFLLRRFLGYQDGLAALGLR